MWQWGGHRGESAAGFIYVAAPERGASPSSSLAVGQSEADLMDRFQRATLLANGRDGWIDWDGGSGSIERRTRSLHQDHKNSKDVRHASLHCISHRPVA